MKLARTLTSLNLRKDRRRNWRSSLKRTELLSRTLISIGINKSYFYNPDLASSGFLSAQAIQNNDKVKTNSNLRDYDNDSTSMTNNAYTTAQKPIYLHKKGMKLFQLVKEEGILDQLIVKI